MSYLFRYCAGSYDKIMKQFKLDLSDIILENIGNITGKKILDIGGGTGTLANLLQCKGAELTLVDPSVEMTQKAREKNKDIMIYTKSLQDLDDKLQGEYFDKVIIRDALHHIENVDEILALSYKYLKPRGEILIWEFNRNSFKAKIICFLERLCLEKSRMFTPESLSQMCDPYFKKMQLNLSNGFEMLYKGEKRENFGEQE